MNAEHPFHGPEGGLHGLRHSAFLLRKQCNLDIVALEKSIDHYTAETESLTSRLAPQNIHGVLSTHISQLCQHAGLLDPLKLQLISVRDHNERLNKADGKILIQQLDLTPGALPIGGHGSPVPEPAAEEEEVEYPEPLGEYFDVLGEIRLRTDKFVYELPMERQEERDERQYRQDQGETVDPSDEIFEMEWATKIRNVEEERASLEVRSRTLKEECESKGLNTDPNDYRRRESDDASAPSVEPGLVIQWLSGLQSPSSGSQASRDR